jgi:hypothetical protein
LDQVIGAKAAQAARAVIEGWVEGGTLIPIKLVRLAHPLRISGKLSTHAVARQFGFRNFLIGAAQSSRDGLRLARRQQAAGLQEAEIACRQAQQYF